MIWQGSFMSFKKQPSSRRRLTGISILKRNLAENNIQRARNPVTPSRMTVRGQFPSKKMQRMVAWESQLERRACYLFEFSVSIDSFREQPRTFILPFKDKIRRYTPDFEVVWSTGEVYYFEIKPSHKIDQLKEYFNAISIYLEEKGLGFSVLTDVELISPIREHNLILLRSYQNYILDQQHINELQIISSLDECCFSFCDLADYFESDIVVYALIAQNYLFADLNKSLQQSHSILINKKRDITDENNLFIYRTAPNFE